MLYKDIKFFNGSPVETIKNESPVSTGATFGLKEKGYALETSNGKYAQYPSQILPNGAFSVVVWARLRNSHIAGTSVSTLLGSTTNGYRGLTLGVDAFSGRTNIALSASNYRVFEYFPDKNWHCYIFTITGAGQTDVNNAQLFVDSVMKSVNATGITTAQDARSGFVYAGGSSSLGGAFISRIKVYDEVISANQILAEQDEFNNFKLIQKPKRGFAGNPKPTDLSREVNNTVGANLFPNGTDWVDTNADGLADGIAVVSDGTLTKTILNGGLFIGNYQQVQRVGGNFGNFQIANSLVTGNTYKVSFEYTTSSNTNLVSQTTVIESIPISVIKTTYSKTFVSLGTYLTIVNTGANNVFAIDNLVIQQLSGLVAAYNMSPKGNTLVDISGNGNNGIVSNCVNTLKGLGFNAKGIVNIGNSTTLQPTKGNFSFSIRFLNKGGTSDPIGCLFRRAGSSYFFLRKLNNSNSYDFSFKDISGYTAYQSASMGIGWLTITLNFTYGENAVLYENGVQIATVSVASLTDSIEANATNVYIGSTGGTSEFFKDEIAEVRVYNRTLSLSEIKAYHNSFVTPYILEDFSTLPIDGSNVLPQGWIAGTGLFKGGEYVMKNGELVTNGGFETDSNWTKASGVSILAGTLNIPAGSGVNTYQSLQSNISKLYKLTFTVLNYVSGTIKIGLGGSVNYFISASANGTYSANVKFGDTTNLIFINNSLSFVGSVDNISITEISPLPTFVKNQRFLQCTQEGTISFPSQWNSGSVEIDWLNNGAVTQLSFVESIYNPVLGTVNGGLGYNIILNSNQGVYLMRTNGIGIANSTTSYFQKNTWYTTRIERTPAGQFTILIKGGLFVPTVGRNGFTLVSTVGGSGTNPVVDATYNSSSYGVLSCGVGDCVAGIRYVDGIKQL